MREMRLFIGLLLSAKQLIPAKPKSLGNAIPRRFWSPRCRRTKARSAFVKLAPIQDYAVYLEPVAKCAEDQKRRRVVNDGNPVRTPGTHARRVAAPQV